MAVWTGNLAFGLVSIPVKLYPATQPKDVRFHLVDPESGRRVRYKRVVEREPRPDLDEAEERPPAARRGDGSAVAPPESQAPPREVEVAYESLARGYEVDDGLVVLDRDEIEQARPARSRSIDIEDFVELSSIDPVFFEKSYYLAPQPTGEKPYALLLRAMGRTGLVGIGRFVLRTKPHLVAIRPLEGVLGLETLYFADEVRPAQPLVANMGSVRVGRQELELAERLIQMLKTGWVAERYADEYREELLRMIAERSPVAEGSRAADEGAPSADVERLMQALKASVDAAKRAEAAPKKRQQQRRKTG